MFRMQQTDIAQEILKFIQSWNSLNFKQMLPLYLRIAWEK